MIRDWLADFLFRLSVSFPPHDWPEPDTDDWAVFFDDFARAFGRNGVSEAEAEDARSLLAENPPRFKADYIPKVVGAVKILRELNPAAAEGSMDDRESALAASKTCIRCFGDGLAIVYASRPSVERKIAETSAAYCVCPYGRWVEKTHREKSPDVHKRIPDLGNVLAGRSFWRLDPPGFDIPVNRPATQVATTVRKWTSEVAAATREPAASPPRPLPWAAPIPPDLPMPRPVARPVEAPPPAAVEPEPEVMTEEELEWL